jgi:hypothetical protein
LAAPSWKTSSRIRTGSSWLAVWLITLIPTVTDFPKIRAISLQHRPSPTNPLGVKGAGEGGIIPVGGLMANAVAGALSSLAAEPKELPLSPPHVWRWANPSQEGEKNGTRTIGE